MVGYVGLDTENVTLGSTLSLMRIGGEIILANKFGIKASTVYTESCAGRAGLEMGKPFSDKGKARIMPKSLHESAMLILI